MNRKYLMIVLTIIFILIIILQGLKDIQDFESFSKISIKDWYWEKTYIKPEIIPIIDNNTIYGDDLEDTKIDTLYVTVLPTVDKNNEKITFDILNENNDFRIEVPTLNMNFIDEINLKSNNSIDLNPTGIITLRGHSTMEDDDKSYKLKLFKETEKWNGMDTIHLNKHPYDPLRIRNKIAFDLLELVPNITSVRTKFVHLYIKDLSESEESDYVDYGLFTNVEQTNNKRFLEDHNLDSNGNLYKVEEFEFLIYEELKDVRDKNYNKEKFEEILEIKNGKTHEKILTMIKDVNNNNLDTQKVLDKHFNRDNYFTWLAVNILLGNYDTQTQNFFLYSPNHSSTWYFLPWDYDGSMGEDKEIQYDKDGKFEGLVGVSMYWNSILHQRIFKVPENIVELNKKIEEIYLILSKNQIKEVVDKYMPIILEDILNESEELKNSNQALNKTVDEVINSTTNNRRLYYDYMEIPMPVYLGNVIKDEDESAYVFEWTYSYDLQGDRLSYSLEISTTPEFNDIVYKDENIKENFAIIDIDPGEYFWKITVIDNKGNIQRAFDIHEEDGIRYFGISKITLE